MQNKIVRKIMSSIVYQKRKKEMHTQLISRKTQSPFAGGYIMYGSPNHAAAYTFSHFVFFSYCCYHHIRWFFGFIPSLTCVSKKFHFGLFEESVTHEYVVVGFTSFTHRTSRVKQKQ
jgi:hypothetical protein